MELKDLFEKLRENYKLISLSALVFGFVGVILFYALPVKYTASGSLYVTRLVEPSPGADFSYEGYYAQQTARSHAEGVIGLLESIDMRKIVLTRMGEEVTGQNLKKAARGISVKKAAPQVILLETKRRTPEAAKSTWELLVDAVLEESKRLNSYSGDRNISVTVIGDSPVVTESYRNIFLNVVLGVVLGAFLSSFWVILREYLD